MNEPVSKWHDVVKNRDYNLLTKILHNDVVFYSPVVYSPQRGKDITIKKLAKIIQMVVDHHGNILWDTSKPDGTPRKLMDVSKINEMGWVYSTELKDGIEKTYQWFLENIDTIKELKYN